MYFDKEYTDKYLARELKRSDEPEFLCSLRSTEKRNSSFSCVLRKEYIRNILFISPCLLDKTNDDVDDVRLPEILTSARA